MHSLRIGFNRIYGNIYMQIHAVKSANVFQPETLSTAPSPSEYLPLRLLYFMIIDSGSVKSVTPTTIPFMQSVIYEGIYYTHYALLLSEAHIIADCNCNCNRMSPDYRPDMIYISYDQVYLPTKSELTIRPFLLMYTTLHTRAGI